VSRSLSIWWDGAIVGSLHVDRHGEMTFAYGPEWLADASRPPLSVSLPKRPQVFKRRECRPFFSGLLPEDAQRAAVARALGISARNDFRLLEALGGDVAGALSFWPEGETPVVQDAAIEARPLADDELAPRRTKRSRCTGRVRRLHQEDFCQALGIPPEQKYADEGGPTWRTSFELLRRVSTRPAVEVLKLLDAAIFNAMIGNADAHGKNFSLLYEEDATTLAPLYDLLCTTAYPDLSPRLAMKIAKAATLEEIGESTWSAFAKDVGIGAPFVRRRVRELAEPTPGVMSDLVEQLAAAGLNVEALRAYADLITSRARRLANTVSR
jgi:HipA-like protein